MIELGMPQRCGGYYLFELSRLFLMEVCTCGVGLSLPIIVVSTVLLFSSVELLQLISRNEINMQATSLRAERSSSSFMYMSGDNILYPLPERIGAIGIEKYMQWVGFKMIALAGF